MKKRPLGRTDLEISELALDTRPFGFSAEETASFQVLDAYHRLGGRFIQGAGGCPPFGAASNENTRAEELVGAWLRTRAIRRDDLVLGTRFDFNRPATGGGIAFENSIRASCENSLRRLRATHLDLLTCNWNTTLDPIEDVLEAATRLIRAGMVRHIVANGFPLWRVADSIHRSRQRNHCRFEAVHTDYSSLSPIRFESGVLKMCEAHRLGLIIESSAGGELASALSGTRRAPLNKIAAAWALRHPQVSSVLITATSADRLHELIGATTLALTDTEHQMMNSAASARHRFTELSIA